MKYEEIFKLKEMLEQSGIPFDWVEKWGYDEEEIERLKKIAPDLIDRYQICYPKGSFHNREAPRWISVIEGFGTYGAEQDRLEIMGGADTTDQLDEVTGWLTADEVFDRIKKHHFRKEKFVMKKTIKVIDEDTLEIKEVTIEEDVTDTVKDDIVENFRAMLNREPEEFYQKYREMKQAEANFAEIYEPFKEKLIKFHEDNPDLPKSIIVGGVKVTYVSPTTRSTIDSKKLKEEEPELVKKYTKNTNVKASVRLEEV